MRHLTEQLKLKDHQYANIMLNNIEHYEKVVKLNMRNIDVETCTGTCITRCCIMVH